MTTSNNTPSALSDDTAPTGAPIKPKTTAPKSILKPTSFATSGRSVSDSVLSSASNKKKVTKADKKEYQQFKASVIAASKHTGENETAKPVPIKSLTQDAPLIVAEPTDKPSHGVDPLISTSSSNRAYTIDEITAALGIMGLVSTVPSADHASVMATAVPDDSLTTTKNEQDFKSDDVDKEEDMADFTFASFGSPPPHVGGKMPDSPNTFDMTKIESDESSDSDWEESVEKIKVKSKSRKTSSSKKSAK